MLLQLALHNPQFIYNNEIDNINVSGNGGFAHQ